MTAHRFGDLDAVVAGGTDGRGGGHGPVAVLLHGFGAPGDDLVGLLPTLRAPAGTRFVFPQAPLELPREYSGGRAWWWIDVEDRLWRRQKGEREDINQVPSGLHEASAKVDALLTAVERALEPPPGKLVLGGFSQGAMLSLDVALRTQRALAGLVLMSPTHIAAAEWEPLMAARKGLPVFMSHGWEDELLLFATSESLHTRLLEHGLPVEWVPFRGGHGIPPEIMTGASDFLTRVLG